VTGVGAIQSIEISAVSSASAAALWQRVWQAAISKRDALATIGKYQHPGCG